MTVPARRRSLALAAAVATAAALGATALTVPAAHAADGPPAKSGLKDGTLEWGFKESFRQYVETGFGDGKIEVTDGTQRTGDGPFTFVDGQGSYDSSSQAVSTTFKGGVHFLGHAKDGKYELDLKFTDLKLVSSDGKGGRITADVTAGGGKPQEDVPIASLDLEKAKKNEAGGALTLAEIPTKLTEEGAKVFSYKNRSFYKAGAALDPAKLVAKTVAAVPNPPAGGDTSGGASNGTAGSGASAGTTGGTSGSASAGNTGGTAGTTGGGASAGASGGASSGTSGEQTGQTSGGTSAGSTSGTSGENSAKDKVYDGRLDWGVKKSFRDYITDGYAKGKIELSGDVAKKGDGYRFAKGRGTYNEAAAKLDATFNGQLHFTGDQGKLDLRFSNLKVKASGTTGTLSADVATKDGETTTKKNDVPLADLTLSADALKVKDGVVSLFAVPAKLTEEGVKVFSHGERAFYKKGAELDPVSLAVTVDEKAKLPEDSADTGSGTGSGSGSSTGGSGSASGTGGAGTTGGAAATTGGGSTGGSLNTASLASTGASTPTAPLLGAAGALVLAGSGAVFAARRRGRGAAQV
ncbi:HtaA domain-containing protein [Streptomyces roseifaciens]|uniref:HtaA domain-containing protein n=1 Tax=Streptomyces roseifaciens TaxID=1488406 RepID=UPI000717E879|nr:HtaA domain-containing protein [Streptomyces roseifaciens]